MGVKAGAVIGSVVFFVIAPGTVAGWVPYALSDWKVAPPLLDVQAIRIIGIVIAAAGLAGLIECSVRFTVKGHGTPAPVAPPDLVVVTGLYRHVRNPMYVAVVSIVVGQGLFFGSVAVLEYAIAVWLVFHLAVLVYEEPTLRKQFGPSYEWYRSNVPRWWPRMRPWPGPGTEHVNRASV